MYQLLNNDVLTAEAIAGIVSVDARNVRERLNKNGFFAGTLPNPSGKGAPIKVYKVEGLSLWGKLPEEKEFITERRRRDDRGRARAVKNERFLRYAELIALNEFLKNALQDVRSACEKAVDFLKDEYSSGMLGTYRFDCLSAEFLQKEYVEGILKDGIGTVSDKDFKGITKRFGNGHLWFYQKRIIWRFKSYVGPFWTDGWQDKHGSAYGQMDQAHHGPHTRYRWWKILESAGLAGKGYGFMKMIFLDDYTGENWVRKQGGKYGLPKCIMVWDILTGALVWCQECDEPNAQAYILAVLNATLYHGIAELPIFFLENSKAATANRVTMLIREIYEDEELERIESGKDEFISKVFKGSKSPIIRNPKHVPTSIGKAFGERRMGFVNTEHNPVAFPALFQGTRSQAQMHVSNTPWVLASSTNRARFALSKDFIPTTSEYVASIMRWAWSDYTSKHRTYLRAWSKAKGLPQTIESVIEYYRPLVKRYPPAHKLAKWIYWATPLGKPVTVHTRGFIACTRAGRELNLVSDEIFTADKIGRPVHVLPVPFSDNEFIIMLVDDPQHPEFLGIAEDFFAETADQAQQMQLAARAARTAIEKDRSQQITLDPAKMIRAGNNDEPTLLNSAPRFIATLPHADDDIIEAQVIEPPITEIDHDLIDDDEFSQLLNISQSLTRGTK